MVELMTRLLGAMNRHDAEGVAECFAPDYRSEQPLHPGRGFAGRDQVLANWASVFDGVPDFRAELLASAHLDGVVWAEQRWAGRHRDGSPFAMQGVMVLGTDDGRIAWARLYMEPVEAGGGDIDAAVHELYRPPRGD